MWPVCFMNLILMRFGYPIAIITREDRLRYYDTLETSQSSDLSGFISLHLSAFHESLEEYEHAAQEQRERVEWAQSLAQRFSAPAEGPSQERVRGLAKRVRTPEELLPADGFNAR